MGIQDEVKELRSQFEKLREAHNKHHNKLKKLDALLPIISEKFSSVKLILERDYGFDFELMKH